MEDSVSAKDQSSASATGGRSASKLLRYPLRSATKSKEDKPQAAAGSSNSSASRRGRSASSVSKSVGVLDLSDKDKPSKPPRRLSIPARSAASPVPKPFGSITPISETKAKKSVNNPGNSDTPKSDVSRSLSRRKFNFLSSATYWLNQIKISESAAKHTISLGFFKLALEAGCEPLQRMRDELKCYVRRHNLVELGDPVKELFQSYNISEDLEQLQVSETCSHVPEEGTRSSDEDVHSSSSVRGTRKMEPKSVKNDLETSQVKESAKKVTQMGSSAARNGRSVNKSSANSKSASGVEVRHTQKKSLKPNKQELNKEEIKVKKQGKELVHEEGPIRPAAADEAVQENKENMDAPQMEISLGEV